MLDKLPDSLRDTAIGVMDYIADGRPAYAERLTARLPARDKARVNAAVTAYFPDGMACPEPETGCLTCRSWDKPRLVMAA